MRASLLLSLFLLGCASDDPGVALTPVQEVAVDDICESVSACKDDLTQDSCVEEVSQSIRATEATCEAAMTAFNDCLSELSCESFTSTAYEGCEDEAATFDSECVDQAASCEAPCGGCFDDWACVPVEKEGGAFTFECKEKEPETGNVGDPCNPEGVGCDNGSVCSANVPGCEYEHCCAAYCCPGEDSCDGSASCVAIGETDAGLCTGQ